jgi:site-specific DNA-methyltransferase (adenine-specific)
MLFAPSVLAELIWLREELSWHARTDRYLLAALAGMLHGGANTNGTPRGLTVAMPNTFAMSPNYVRRYIVKNQLKPPVVDVLDALEHRIQSFPAPASNFVRGKAWMQDASMPTRYPRGVEPPRLIFTSPPYLQVMKYAKLNWIRHWLIGSVPSDVDAHLFASASTDKYLAFMKSCIARFSSVLADDGYCCLVIGDVRRGDEEIRLADAVADSCVRGSGLRVLATVRDSIPIRHKVSRIWGARRGRATRTDRILILGGPKRKQLPTLPPIVWRST